MLTPFGGAVHSPWATAIAARLERGSKLKVEFQWSDDGFIFRLPASSTPPEISNFLVPSAEAEKLVIDRLATTQLFAARFRDALIDAPLRFASASAAASLSLWVKINDATAVMLKRTDKISKR